MITDLVVRISGTVDFTDGTTQKFGVVREDGALVEPSSTESLEAFKQLWTQRHTPINALLNSLGATFIITTAHPTTQKTVSDWVFLVNGTITRSDGSSGHFNAVYDVKGGNRVTGVSVFAEVKADATYKALFDAALEAIAGANKVVIS